MEELSQLEQELSGIYLRIAAVYKKMSKTKDRYSLDIMQSGVEHMLNQALKVKNAIDPVRAEVLRRMAAGDPFPKGRYV